MSGCFFLVFGEELEVGAYVFRESAFVFFAYLFHLNASEDAFVDSAELMYAVVTHCILYLLGVELGKYLSSCQ